MEQDPTAKMAPMIGFFVWLIFILVVLALAAVVGPRIWQGASYHTDQGVTPALAQQPASQASR